MKILFYGLILFAFLSCGENSQTPEGFTRVIFGNSQKGMAATLNGGAYVYIQNVDIPAMKGNVFFLDEAANFNPELILPNGNYHFHGIGYPLAASPLTSTNAYCGSANGGAPVTLSGGTQVINVELSDSSTNTKCINSPFSSTNYNLSTYYKPISLANCNTDPGVIAPASCSGVGRSSGTHMGYDVRVSLVSYHPDGPPENPFSVYVVDPQALSYCIRLLSDVQSTGIYLPVGTTANSPFWVRLEVFPSADNTCTGTVVETYDFQNGLSNGGSGSNGGTGVIYTDGSYVQIQYSG